jgi:toxin ParE1/3/4
MQRPNVVVHGDARRELLEARDYIDEHRPGHGERFVAAIEQEFERLVEFPRMGKPLILGARRRTVRGWPYSIVYQPLLDRVYVIAIAHHRRRPDYWRKRLIQR